MATTRPQPRELRLYRAAVQAVESVHRGADNDLIGACLEQAAGEHATRDEAARLMSMSPIELLQFLEIKYGQRYR